MLNFDINKYVNSIFKFLLFLIVIFISSDIFLAIDISGATIRLSQILFLIIISIWFFYFIIIKKSTIYYDRLLLPLFLFCTFSFLPSLNIFLPPVNFPQIVCLVTFDLQVTFCTNHFRFASDKCRKNV